MTRAVHGTRSSPRGRGSPLRRLPPAIAVAGTVTAVLLITAAAGGCVSASESADSARRRDLVLVPEDARPVDRLQWRDVRSVQPLNRRLVLFQSSRRPYLLVLESPCQGLRPDSMLVVDNRSTFTPSVDRIIFADPFNNLAGGTSAAAAYGAFTTGVPSARAGFVGNTMCRPDTLYAIRDEDVDWLRESLGRD